MEIVMTHGPRADRQQPIVVAVDGSRESANALRWAAGQAIELRKPLRIITCYEQHFVAGEAHGVSWDRFESTKKSVEAEAASVIEDVLGTAEFEHIVALGPVDRVLVDYSHDAEMIVLGTRSSTGLRGKLRSSTTNRVTGQVACPVMSIPLGEAEQRRVSA
jgi:nucleotide-binding universal stress UspA family protein